MRGRWRRFVDDVLCRELLDRWPGTAPRADSLWRVLARGVELGMFRVTGKGTKTEPFRFTLLSRSGAAEVKLAEDSTIACTTGFP
jgi:hypothetical protein